MGDDETTTASVDQLHARLTAAYAGIADAVRADGWRMSGGVVRSVEHRTWAATFRRLLDDGQLDAFRLHVPPVLTDCDAGPCDLEPFVRAAVAVLLGRPRDRVADRYSSEDLEQCVPYVQRRAEETVLLHVPVFLSRDPEYCTEADAELWYQEWKQAHAREVAEARADGERAGRLALFAQGLVRVLETQRHPERRVTAFRTAQGWTEFPDGELEAATPAAQVYVGDGMAAAGSKQWRRIAAAMDASQFKRRAIALEPCPRCKALHRPTEYSVGDLVVALGGAEQFTVAEVHHVEGWSVTYLVRRDDGSQFNARPCEMQPVEREYRREVLGEWTPVQGGGPDDRAAGVHEGCGWKTGSWCRRCGQKR